MQYHAIPCNTMQHHEIPCNTMQYHAKPCNTIQYHAIPCNTMQYHAILCNTLQYHASLITADGAYHCPVGSIMAIFFLLALLLCLAIAILINWSQASFVHFCHACSVPTTVKTVETPFKAVSMYIFCNFQLFLI